MALRTRRRSEEGFTLIEMMTVVVIVGVLAVLAVYGVRKYILSAKSGEAVAMMASIKTAEEAFKDETFVYFDVSTNFATNNFYPTTTPGKVKVQWGGGNATLAGNWKTLGVQPTGPVQFAYAVVATAPGATVPAVPTITKDNAAFNLPQTATQWMYVVAAKSDLGGRAGVDTVVLSHSLSTEIFIENEGE
jgi:type IV pilus assembly protein PilA